MPHQETFSRRVIDVAAHTAAKAPAPHTEFDQLSTMSVEALVARIGHSTEVATHVVMHRSDVVGEVMQRALVSSPATAMVVLAVLRYEFVRSYGSGFQTSAWVRSVMRLTGPHADEVKVAMQAIIDETHAEQSKHDPITHRNLSQVDGLNDKIDLAKRDPEAGKLFANFFDRPAEVVAQLLSERADPKKLQRHVSLLVELMQGSPAAGRAVIAVLDTSRDPDWFELKHMIVDRLHGAIDQELFAKEYHFARGEPDGGAHERIERMIPLLAEVVSQPDVAAVMTDMQLRGTGTSELRAIMKHVLDWSYSEATRNAVRTSIGKGASEMFRDSLVETDQDRRRGMASRTAEFLGTAARGAADSGPEKSVLRQMGVLLKEMSSFIPSAHKYPTRAAGLLLSELGTDKAPVTWTRDHLSQMMYQIYASMNPPPRDKPESSAMREHGNAYLNWAEGPLNTYSRLVSGHD